MKTLRSDKFLDAIRAGHVRFKARFAKRDNIDGDAPEWSDFKTQTVELYVMLRDAPWRQWPAGWILSLSPVVVVAKNGTPIVGWAEYSEDSYGGNGEFLAEEWRMQLLEVE